ncbi:PilC/PilY family type IV pilus protein [Lysobacter sp. LF1]|uniref:PilC/PilY family type IV pilus protein n=1 Tax=Lysobacter stagni TaxID=3045172 RepID=A0ABT6XKU6_9GAMM|nr:PilC/PilY family type IV pilus protein [Lysobacter sp. LF1]MDI9240786.1 PilC/PilY family type IV pilus protein [Lysobacter sp. LF1]
MTLHKSIPNRMAPLRAALLACLATTLALPVHATTSFPDFPLQTGSGSAPPNILFILDDSGSMAWDFMPGAVAADANTIAAKTSPDQIGLKTYIHNSLYYDPRTEYKPWMQADGTRFTAGTSLTSAYASTSLIDALSDVSNDVHEFYVPKANVTDYTNSANFDRYTIGKINGVLHVYKGASTRILNDNNRDISAGNNRDFSLSLGSGVRQLQVNTSGGSGNVTLSILNSSGVTLCTSNSSNGNTESCTILDPAQGNYTARLTAPSGRNNDVGRVDTVAYTVTGEDATPTGRSQADELTNYAIWYSYHRTRSKTAKAGASEAFASLGTKFRVGFDSIWNRNGSTSVSGDLPAYQIPVGTDNGLFKGANKSDWFGYLQRANANSGTPLHGALKRAGDYYETQTGASGPWGPESTAASQLSCRQSYAILTTDGYWNDDDGGFSNAPGSTVIGNTDNTAGTRIVAANGTDSYTYAATTRFKDSATDTLADVAMNYWKRDLRTDLANNVPTSDQNPGFWQHMSTFGISIGLQGTLNPASDLPLIEAGSKAWPNPWKTATNTNNSWDNESNRRIDDLWHAAVNGHGSFVAATNPKAFSDALTATLASIQRRQSSGSNVSTNGATLNAGSKLFQATYFSGEWSGDVQAFSLVGGTIASTESWSVKTYAAANATAFTNRGVYTFDGTAGATFPTSDASLPQTQVSLLGRSTGLAQVSAANNASYIKGSAALEKSNGGKLRNRASRIGDIVNSSPFYVKATDTLFIGANDGMLHSINAGTGAVRFSYVPAGIDFAALASLSDPDYSHKFFVDGGIDVTTPEQGKNKNILAASLGRGGRGVFALDVTTPGSFSATDVLWDKTFSSSTATVADADMGYVLGAPLVRQGNNNKTLVIVGNGVDSDNASSVLFIYVLNDNGTLNSTIKINTGATGSNGMAEARAADVNNDGKADYVYAGDLQGNLWKFDLSSTVASNWAVANSGVPMFVAKDASDVRQPITSAVALARNPQTTQIYVSFGTGKYITNDDVTNATPQTQTMYSIIDNSTVVSGRSDLEKRTIPYTGTDSKGRTARSWEEFSELSTGKKGWYLDLGLPTPYAKGERVVSAPFLRSRALWFSTIIPTAGEACDMGGKGFLNAIDMFTGTNPQANGTTTGFIDVNANGQGDDKLGNPTQTDNTNTHTGGNNQFVGGVDIGVGMVGQGDGVGSNVYACGSNATCGKEAEVPTPGAAKRLNWRELFNRD